MSGPSPEEYPSTRRLGGVFPPPAPSPEPARAVDYAEVSSSFAPLALEICLAHPAVAAGEEPAEPAAARITLKPRPGAAMRPRLDYCFLLDASASMHRFVLDPEQRAAWQQRAESRGEVSRQQADGRTGLIWTGQTLRELERSVSTPMLSALRGIWRTLEALGPEDRISVLGFADQWSAVYEDEGHPDKTARHAAAKTALARLGSGVDTSGLGRGTRLAGALRHAIDRANVADATPTVRRLILISDGIIEDAESCRPLLEQAVDRGVVISVVGVGEEFDEEFLMPIADLGRGTYAYAATAQDLQRILIEEVGVTTETVGRRAELAIIPANGTVIRDVYPISPEICQFQTVWVDEGAWRFRVGDISAARPSEFLCELHPGAFAEGEVRIGSARVRGLLPASNEPFETSASIQLLYTSERALLTARDEETVRAQRHVEIYLEERRGAAAAARGDHEAATRHLQQATRLLRKVGATDMALEMEAEASGEKDATRTKRVKAGTRKLGKGE